MYVLQGTNRLGNALKHTDLHPALGGGKDLNISDFSMQKAPQPPRFIRESDIRPSTMKILGKSNPESIVLSKTDVVEDENSMQPQYGNMRHHKKGLYTNPKYKINTKLMPRAASDFAFKNTSLKQPN